MFCTNCGNHIKKDSSFCPYCGKSTKYVKNVYCLKCGKAIKEDSKFCCYCGSNIIRNRNPYSIQLSKLNFANFRSLINNKFIKLYILWLIENVILLYKAQDAYSNYFNSTNVSHDDWLISDKGIYPKDWLYPLKNIFSGITGQDPVYIYDITEFILYVIVLSVTLALLLLNRHKIFKKKRTSEIFYWAIVYLTLWMVIVFPMGLFGLDALGWSFFMGGIIIAVYAYNQTFSKIKS